MELGELLDSEGLDADELMGWARRRAGELISGLAAEPGQSDELLSLLESDARIDVDAAALGDPEAGRSDAVEPERAAAQPEVAAPVEFDEESQTGVIDLDLNRAPDPEPASVEPEEDTVVSARRREPSAPQPTSADELPPPPDHPRLAAGEPEPILETVDTGPMDLGSPEAEALLAATSTLTPQLDAASAEEDEELEEIEFDELVELDDEELELLEEVDDDDEGAEAPPPPPPPPPGGSPPPLAMPDAAPEQHDEEQAPVRTGDTASHPVLERDDNQASDTDESADADQPGTTDEPSDEHEAPVQTGDTATHPVLEMGEESAAADEDELPVRTGGATDEVSDPGLAAASELELAAAAADDEDEFEFDLDLD